MYHDLWVASCLVLILGVVFAAAGGVLKYLSRRNETYKGHAEARVVDILPERRVGPASLSEFHSRQVAVFEFFAGGKPVKVRDTADTYPCPYTMNQRIRICYNPEDPREYAVETADRRERLGSVLNLLGVAAILAGCILFWIYAVRN